MPRLYQLFASSVVSYHNCTKSDNPEWETRWQNHLKYLSHNHLPHGSGFDCGTTCDIDASNSKRLVFHTEFHHMNECGSYDGWTKHTITLTPAFEGYNIRISGRNRNNIKEYIADIFFDTLFNEINWPKDI